VDLNVKNVDPEVARRLAEQAAAEGMSQQEWLRTILRRNASRMSPAELVAQRATMTPMSEGEFTDIQLKVAGLRRGQVERLGASGRGR
jgi:plasmid stability protein